MSKLIDSFFNFMADPSGLSKEEIQKELETEGIDIKELEKRVKKIVNKHKSNRDSVA